MVLVRAWGMCIAHPVQFFQLSVLLESLGAALLTLRGPTEILVIVLRVGQVFFAAIPVTDRWYVLLDFIVPEGLRIISILSVRQVTSVLWAAHSTVPVQRGSIKMRWEAQIASHALLVLTAQAISQ